jgi:NADP-dependent 3-hydroxy acid dehydrogenase YdfG
MSKKVWFIPGASRGFGRVWAEAALNRGEKVAVTARKLEAVKDLKERYGEAVLPLALDVTDAAQVADALARAHRYFGKLDIVLNNAGYALVGAIEEPDEASIRAEFDTNFFGTLSVIRAALPYLREQGSGHVIGVSSVSGLVAHPISGYYHASKWAFEAVHESLSQEVKQFGIKVTLLEPGPYATDFASQSSLVISAGLDAYADMRAHAFAAGAKMAFGDPHATVDAVFKVVDSENPPLRIFLGTEGPGLVPSVYAARLAVWEEWGAVSNAAQGVAKAHEIASL